MKEKITTASNQKQDIGIHNKDKLFNESYDMKWLLTIGIYKFAKTFLKGITYSSYK